jgi:hypothetical protein
MIKLHAYVIKTLVKKSESVVNCFEEIEDRNKHLFNKDDLHVQTNRAFAERKVYIPR